MNREISQLQARLRKTRDYVLCGRTSCRPRFARVVCFTEVDRARAGLTFPPSVAQKVMGALADSGAPLSLFRAIGLTRREAEVLKGLCDGMRNREMAVAMGISTRTVECHVDRLLLKLGVRSRTEAVRRAMEDAAVR